MRGPLLPLLAARCCFLVTAPTLESRKMLPLLTPSLPPRTRKNVDETDHKGLGRDRRGPPARICCPWPGEMGTTLGSRLADRPHRRLFRIHVDGLPRLATGAHGRKR